MSSSPEGTPLWCEWYLAPHPRMATADRPDQLPPGVFEALHQIGMAVGGVLEPVGLARLVAEHARTLLSAQAFGLWLADEPNNALKALYLENWVHPAPVAQPDADPRGVVAVPLLGTAKAVYLELRPGATPGPVVGETTSERHRGGR